MTGSTLIASNVFPLQIHCGRFAGHLPFDHVDLRHFQIDRATHVMKAGHKKSILDIRSTAMIIKSVVEAEVIGVESKFIDAISK